MIKTKTKNMTKIEQDLINARIFRENALHELNYLINRPPNKAILSFIHEQMKIMNLSEKAKNNILINRICEVGMEEAMGNDCVLVSWDKKLTQHIAIRKITDPEIYYKMTRKTSLDALIDNVLNEIYFLFLVPSRKDPLIPDHSMYALVRGDSFDWELSISEGNKNRVYAIHKSDKGIYAGRRVNPRKNLQWEPVTESSIKKAPLRFDLGEELTPKPISISDRLKSLISN